MQSECFSLIPMKTIDIKRLYRLARMAWDAGHYDLALSLHAKISAV